MTKINNGRCGNGFFISFEGVESSGKTTQVHLLTRWLKDSGYPVVQTREPGGCGLGEKIRTLLLNPDEGISAEAEMLLFAASRAQLVREVIRPALAEGNIVVCDRFVDSSLAYQGYGLGIDLDVVWQVNRPAVGETVPDLTLVVGAGPQLKGVQARDSSDRIEARHDRFHERVRCGYLRLAKDFSHRMEMVDSSVGAEAAAERVRQLVAQRIEPMRGDLKDA